MPDPRFQFADLRPTPEEFEDASWTQVEAGGLEQPVHVRLGYSADGRRIITGLMVGATFPHAEITSTSLRKIRIGAILEQLFDGYDEASPPPYDDFDAQIEWGLMHQAYDQHAAHLPESSRAGERGAEGESLIAFADRYRVEVDRNPRRAMTATAEAMHISRATANRWAKKARNLGLISGV